MQWLNDVKSKMYQFNNNQPSEYLKFKNISTYILEHIIPINTYDVDNYEIDNSKEFVFISTISEVFKIRRDRIFAYLKDDNDCLGLAINKHFSKFINLETITAIEYERGDIYE